MPFFSTIIVGCFVRIGIGAHEGRMVYRVSMRVVGGCGEGERGAIGMIHCEWMVKHANM